MIKNITKIENMFYELCDRIYRYVGFLQIIFRQMGKGI